MAFSDADCGDMDKGTLSYDMYCGAIYDETEELKTLKSKIRSNATFIFKWRTTEDGSEFDKNRKIAFKNFEAFELKTGALITELAQIHCDLDLEIGGSIETSGQATGHSYCMKKFVLKNEKVFYKKLNDYTQVERPSFNCNKASTNIENEICKHYSLSVMDKNIASYYAKSVEKGVDVEQKTWIKAKRNACEKSTEIYSCLYDVMTERSEYMSGLTRHW
jgi:hypothetical protein